MNNVFFVYTEYHIIMSIDIILNKYDNANNYIYYIPNHRIKSGLKIDRKCIEFVELDNDLKYTQVWDAIRNSKPDQYFFFQESGALNIFLEHEMHEGGITINLVQDGMKPYAIWNKKHAFLSKIKDTITVHKALNQQGIKFRDFRLLDYYNYGCSPYIDSLWLTNPLSFNNKNSKQIIQIPKFTDNVVDAISQTFEFENKFQTENVVLIIGQNKRDESIQEDVTITKELVNIYKGRKILYKSHPNTSKHHFQQLKSIGELDFVDGNYPVELLILKLKKSIIISGYSTSMLTFNPDCRYYWISKVYSKDRNSSQFEIINPTAHITEIYSLNELK